jgi:hypothetical protein
LDTEEEWLHWFAVGGVVGVLRAASLARAAAGACPLEDNRLDESLHGTVAGVSLQIEHPLRRGAALFGVAETHPPQRRGRRRLQRPATKAGESRAAASRHDRNGNDVVLHERADLSPGSGTGGDRCRTRAPQTPRPPAGCPDVLSFGQCQLLPSARQAIVKTRMRHSLASLV